jgi:hypothetical protein
MGNARRNGDMRPATKGVPLVPRNPLTRSAGAVAEKRGNVEIIDK